MLVRIGVSSGKLVRETEDFFGKNVIFASRIADQGQGGEILVSGLSKELRIVLGTSDLGKSERWR